MFTRARNWTYLETFEFIPCHVQDEALMRHYEILCNTVVYITHLIKTAHNSLSGTRLILNMHEVNIAVTLFTCFCTPVGTSA